MKKTILMTFMSLFVLLGCGKEATLGAHPEFTHERNLYAHDFDADAIAWEFDNHEGLKVHKSANDLYLQFVHHSTLPNVQFFLDVDNDEKTGVPIERGADYMIENGWLYEATSENKWGWKEVAQVKMHVEKDIKDTVKVPLSLLSHRSGIYKIHTQALDDTWEPKVYSPHELGTKSTYQ